MITQKLQKEKLLCGKNFGNFVNAWNLVQDRVSNIKGDADTNPQQGHIQVDNSDVNHPVIRLVNLTNATSNTSLSSNGVSSLIGETAESVQLSGNIAFTGNTYSGIRFNSEIVNDVPTMDVDLIGREDADTFAVRKVNDADSKTMLKVFAASDLTLTEVDVITDIAIDGFELDIDGNPRIKYTITKTPVTVWKTGTGNDSNIYQNLGKQEVVTASEYSAASHQFKNQIKEIYGYVSDEVKDPKVVFTATEHQE